MLNLTLEDDFDTTTSSYFDFVDKKTKEDCPAPKAKSREPVKSGKDAFVVQVMDEVTSQQLKRRYFNGHAFPE